MAAMLAFLADHWTLIAALAAAGAFAGFVAGLFGIGGGIIIVPALYQAFGVMEVGEENRMHVAVATSLATIIATSLRSASEHAKRGAVEWSIVQRWAPWLVTGALAGAIASRFVPGEALKVLFALGATGVALRMAFGGDPQPRERPRAEGLPGRAAEAGAATGLGFASAWMGIGGGVFGVMALTIAGRPMHKAIGTAATFGVAIGAPGALGFILAGLGVEGRPPLSLGYVNLPGFLIIAALTVSTAPLGVRLAHGLSRTLLRRLFASGLAVIAAHMLWEAFGPAPTGV